MKATVIVLDSLGIGALPDAADYGDEGSNTFLHIVQQTQPDLPNMKALGLYNILSLPDAPEKPQGAYGKAQEQSAGKDTMTGHWELMGLISHKPFPTYPYGFPKDITDQLTAAFGREIIGNKAISGTEILKELGAEHMRTGKPIVYTSADSVLQIAAHADVIPLAQLYDFCEKARTIMQGDHAVGRIIARPFSGAEGHFVRTVDRKDYTLPPSGRTTLDLLSEAGKQVWAVGKIEDIFSRQGITYSTHTHTNTEGIAATIDLLGKDFDGLLFVNLVDFDMLYGHRNDPQGYARALMEFDRALPQIRSLMAKEDILIITGDHGCDPTTASTDHSREYVPVLVAGQQVEAGNLGIVKMSDVGATVAKALKIPYALSGQAFLKEK